MSERCGNCRFCAFPPIQADGRVCRRRAPLPLSIDQPNRSQDGGAAVWPVVDPVGDWCGEWASTDEANEWAWDIGHTSGLEHTG